MCIWALSTANSISEWLLYHTVLGTHFTPSMRLYSETDSLLCYQQTGEKPSQSWTWWHMLVIPALGKYRQNGQGVQGSPQLQSVFKISLGFGWPCLQQTNYNNNKSSQDKCHIIPFCFHKPVRQVSISSFNKGRNRLKWLYDLLKVIRVVSDSLRLSPGWRDFRIWIANHHDGQGIGKQNFKCFSNSSLTRPDQYVSVTFH